MSENYLAIGIISVMMLAILFYMVKMNSVFDQRKKKLYYGAVVVTILMVVCQLITTYADNKPNFGLVNSAANTIGCALSPLIPVVLIYIFSAKYSKRINVAHLPMAINFILCVLSPFFGFIFSVSETNVYKRGPLFWVYIVTVAWSVMLLFRCIYTMTGNQHKQSKPFYSGLLAFLVFGVVIEVAFPYIHTTWLCVAFSMVCSYAYGCEFGDRHDTLTTLYNRREFEIEKQTLAEKEKATIIMFDVDDFKKINDNYGHSYGDYCLNVIGTTIGEVFSADGMGFRIGGDEFCVITESTDETDITQHMNLFLKYINIHRAKNPSFPMVSFGYGMYFKASGIAVEKVINCADEELYKYKRIHKAMRAGQVQ